MPATRSRRLSAHDEVFAFSLNASTGGGAPPPRRLFRTAQPALRGHVGILLGARQREFLLDDRLRQHEPGMLVAGRQDAAKRAERIEARQERRLQPLAPRVEPHRGRPGQDADAVVRPDRRPVLHAFGIVPHAVGVDDGGAGFLRDGDHAAIDMMRHAGDHLLRRRARAARSASSGGPDRGCRRCRRR